MAKTKQEKLQELQEKKKHIQEQERILKARISADARKQHTKNLIETGKAVYSVLGDEFREGDIQKLTEFLKVQEQRDNCFSKAMGRPQKEEE